MLCRRDSGVVDTGNGGFEFLAAPHSEDQTSGTCFVLTVGSAGIAAWTA